MPTAISWIHHFENKALMGIMPRPRGGDWLEDEISHLKKCKVDVLISLLEKTEVQEPGLQNEDLVCQENRVKFKSFPIPDRGIPSSSADVDRLILELKRQIDQGNSIVIHCRMGIGRSSIIAGALMLTFDRNVDHILQTISKARQLQIPDTMEQVDWLKRRSKMS
jgi:protein-tyrosine phosphatase